MAPIKKPFGGEVKENILNLVVFLPRLNRLQGSGIEEKMKTGLSGGRGRVGVVLPVVLPVLPSWIR